MKMMIMGSGGNWCWYPYTATSNSPAWEPAGTNMWQPIGCITAPGQPPHPYSYYKARGITVIAPQRTKPSPLPAGPKTGHKPVTPPPATGQTWCYYQNIGITGGINGWYPKGTYSNPYQCLTGVGKPSWTPSGAKPITGGGGSLGGGGIGLLLGGVILLAVVARIFGKRRG